MVNAASLAGLQVDLKEQARALGFAACGFAPAAMDPLRTERLERWLGDGAHGDMEWMVARKDQRSAAFFEGFMRKERIVWMSVLRDRPAATK